jgi:hypothetical protein
VPLSVEAFQARLMEVVVREGEFKPVGKVGGVVSAGGGVLFTVMVTVEGVDRLPAVSLEIAEIV